MSEPDVTLPRLPARVEIFDTTLRDGAQLEGISLTVDDKLRIAEQLDHLGVEYREANLVRSDLYTADEAFLSGTAAEVVPIRSVDDRELGEPGSITREIQSTYFAAVKGEVDRYKDWNEHV